MGPKAFDLGGTCRSAPRLYPGAYLIDLSAPQVALERSDGGSPPVIPRDIDRRFREDSEKWPRSVGMGGRLGSERDEIPLASRHESRQHRRGKQLANRITNKSDGSNGAHRFVPFNRFPNTRISSLDRVGIQRFKNTGRKNRASVGRKKGKQFFQIVDFGERHAIPGQERVQIFPCALLCMETDGAPGT